MQELRLDDSFGSIMIIVPHQDDEILMAAGVLYKAAEESLPVTVVMATNGDCDSEDYTKGKTRLKETIQGCKILGVKKEQLVFMGYADTGMPPEDSFVTHLYEERNPLKVYPSSCSGMTYSLEEKPEFHMEMYGEHARYCRGMFKTDLKEIIEKYSPQNIFTTSEFDMHGDHAALCRFVYEALDEIAGTREYTPNLYCGLVHSGAGDDRWPIPDTEKFGCPQGFEKDTEYLWRDRFVLSLPVRLKRSLGMDNLKYQALLKYETALEPGAYEFLMAFIKDEEIFWKVR